MTDHPAEGAAFGSEPASLRLHRSAPSTAAWGVVDAVIAVIATAAGAVWSTEHGGGVLTSAFTAATAAFLWFVLLQWSKALAVPLLRSGTPELRHVVVTTFVVFGGAAILNEFVRAPILDGLAKVSLPIALIAIVVCRLVRESWLRASDGRARNDTPTLVVGGYYSVRATCLALGRARATGARIVGACVPEEVGRAHRTIDLGEQVVPIVGTDREVIAAVTTTGATVVALTATDSLGPGDLRTLIWELQELSVELIVTPGVVDIAGHRIAYASVGDMPMLHIAMPQHARADSLAKRLFDIVFSAAAILASAPVMIAAAVAIKVDSSGPVFYRSTRIGEDDAPFEMIKFRSMFEDADQRLEDLRAANQGSGALFKMHDDPRVTRVGRFLRRYSIDELPQFFNVLRGEMSVVGPRPALGREVDEYSPVMRRRLLVKPGITGAWQVSGRSDLSWNESIRMDVGYVENWSLARDLMIVVRTVRAVLASDGAY
ncbi:sugar transferase [Nocardiopsis tropica]|uniref:sugar transferase n=1 Tax=Tsukamurella strandjordii TaxID=147577 RepID=UPI0031D611D7